MQKRVIEKLEAMGACSEAIEWLEAQPSQQAAWDNCQNNGWMHWLLGRLDDYHMLNEQQYKQLLAYDAAVGRWDNAGCADHTDRYWCNFLRKHFPKPPRF